MVPDCRQQHTNPRPTHCSPTTRISPRLTRGWTGCHNQRHSEPRPVSDSTDSGKPRPKKVVGVKMLSTLSILALALVSTPETSDVLAAWDKGCAAIRSYDVAIRAESTTFFDADNQSDGKPPLKEAGNWRQVFWLGDRRIEQQGDDPSKLPLSIFVSDGDVARFYYPEKKSLLLTSSKSASPSGPGFLWYEFLYRGPSTWSYCDILRARPATRVESATKYSCVLYSPPLIGQFEYAPFGFRIVLETSKNSMPKQIDILLSVSGTEIVSSRLENTLAEVSAGVWAPVKVVCSTYPAVAGSELKSRKSIETVAIVHRERSSFNREIVDRTFHLDVPADVRIEDGVGIGRAAKLFGKSDDPGAEIATAVRDSRLEGSRVLLMLGIPGDRFSQQLALLTDMHRPDEVARLGKAFQGYRAIGLAAGDPVVVKIMANDFGIDVTKVGFPSLVVLDGEGHVVASERLAPEKRNSRRIDVVSFGKFLSKYADDIQNADELLSAALAQASRDQKRVFLQLAGPDCAPCLAMSRFLDQQKQIVDQHFVILKIGAARQVNADALIKRFRGSQSQGIPWVAILDSDSKVLATSDDAEGKNTGFENEHLLRMLTSTAERMTLTESRQLRDALNERLKKPTESVTQ